MKLDNPLTPKEKGNLYRLSNHDVVGPLNGLYNQIGQLKRGEKPDLEVLESRAMHLNFILSTIDDLSRDHFIISWTSFNPRILFSYLENIFGESLDYSLDYSKDVAGKGHPIYTMLYTLSKNAINNGANHVHLRTSLEEFPAHAIYIPEEADGYEQFVGIHVEDNGRGFPKDKMRIPKRCPPGRGFGLYFTGLVGKAFRAPISIESKKGNTRVSFYHPIYEV